MTRFRYRARTAAGELVRGALTGPDAETVLAGLHARALFVVAIARDRSWNLSLPALPRRSVSARARSAFFRCFATLVRAGIPLRRALDVTIERSDDRVLRATLADVRGEVERGVPLSAALAARPQDFSRLVVAMIAAGETGGILDDVLERIATFLERDDELRKRLLAALAYPLTVLAAAILLVAFLLVRVVPMFSQLFEEFHVPLPPSTRVLLALSGALARPAVWIVVVASIVLGAALFVALRRDPRGQRLLDRARLRFPVLGKLTRTAMAARIARMLGTLVHSGVDLGASLDVIVPAAGSAVYADVLRTTALSIRQGEPLATPLRAAAAFDPMFVTLVAVGEETGMLDAMLIKLADYFDADVAATIATLGSIVEPALILVLGAIVGLIVSSVFIPLYALIGSVSQ